MGYRKKCLSGPVKDRVTKYCKYLACSVSTWHSIKSYLKGLETIKLNGTISVLFVFLKCFIVLFSDVDF